ncbi:serine threonine-kinase kinX, putative [Babesia caballi]|uniref:Serine threonine-kinase kinX, putative n=1 Tax=Babesia caballi TaxID=5871 RepID=A0AAV4LT97_BABCB|nr:serine threonine-kinase kinX, putative [Babesia caballi]
MVSRPKYSLTDAPETLKEAIDWLLKIKKDNGINGLASAFKEMLDEEVADVARNVQALFGVISDNVILKLNEADEQIRKIPEQDFADPETILQNLSMRLDPFADYSETYITPDNMNTVKEWILTVESNRLEVLITDLAVGVEKFVKSSWYGILDHPLESTYKSVSQWNDIQPADKKTCATILIAIMPVIYTAVSYLYWRCTPSTYYPVRSVSWSRQHVSANKGLKIFLMALDYEESYLNNQKNGETIVSSLERAFPKELNNAYRAAYPTGDPTYQSFLGMLQRTALGSMYPTSSTKSPLTSLYLVSYRYLTYPLDDNSTADNTLLGLFGAVVLVGGAYGFDVGGFGTAIDRLLGFN